VFLGILGNKIGMTQIFDASGDIVPVTIIKVGPCVITQIKTSLTDGYDAIQIGYDVDFKKSLNKPQLGHLEKSNISALKYLKEYRIENPELYTVGQLINSSLFKSGEFISVSGRTSGKGYSGLQKCHNFARGPMTHGSKNHRGPGSIGMGTTPGRVFPGKKMSGQLGNTNTCIKRLQIIQINFEENLLIIKGSIPGKTGNLVNIKKINNNL
jgi:large subunit ribosomal protein L3